MRRLRSPLVLFALSTGACSGENAASLIARPPEWNPVGQTKCHIAKTPMAPLIVEWPSADRAALEADARRGVVAVRYSGCEMEVLAQCTGRSRYRYTAVTRKVDRVSIKNTDDLYANVPLGAAKLEATLKRAGELEVAMTIVGRLEAGEGVESMIDRQHPACAQATHVIAGVTVGAFSFHAGADAQIGGGVGEKAGAGSTAKRERLAEDGDTNACHRSTDRDDQPPEGCGAFLRVEVVPIGGPAPMKAQMACPYGSVLEGSVCVRRRDVAEAACPPGTTLSQAGCIPSISMTCPGGMRFEAGRGCVPSAVAAAPPVAQGPCPIGMAWIEGGTFGMGSERGSSIDGPVRKTSVGAFCIDVGEVTVASYDACAKSGACQPAPVVESPYPMSKTSLCNEGHPERQSHPINCVDFRQAEGFCRARGARLPTEQEWEFAARSGAEQRTYPWGETKPGAGQLNACGIECVEMAKHFDTKLGAMYPSGDSWPTTAPVGSFPAGVTRAGVHDLAGNVAEWTASPICASAGHAGCADPRRIVRGGSWASYDTISVMGSARAPYLPDQRSAFIGFRCAKTP